MNIAPIRIGVIGGGIMGITLAYYLAKQNHHVEVFEASSELGGLAGPLALPDGTAVDRFYHAILSSDSQLADLCAELGLSDRMRFNQTRMGFYWRKNIYSMNNVIEFMRFPPLGWVDRFRLGLTVLAAQRVSDWRSLESVSVKEWLLKFSGKTTYDNIWRPMLKAKFDGNFDDIPATWIWSRLVRIKSTRKGVSQKEMSGHLIGGYITLLQAMANKIAEKGGRIHLKTSVQEICIENERMTGVRLSGETRQFDRVVVTAQTPVFQRLITAASKEYHDFLSKTDYLGIVAPLLVLSKPLTGYWTLNITDDRFPFTGVIETTTYIDPEFVGGHHLVYLPKYTLPGSQWQTMSDDEIKQVWLMNLKEMLPGFDQGTVKYFLVHRERYVEPLHPINSTHLIPPVKTPVKNLYLVTTSQIYPALTNGESVCRHALDSAAVIEQNTD
jgi:protoporphyrinogen oxidase